MSLFNLEVEQLWIERERGRERERERERDGGDKCDALIVDTMLIAIVFKINIFKFSPMITSYTSNCKTFFILNLVAKL